MVVSHVVPTDPPRVMVRQRTLCLNVQTLAWLSFLESSERAADTSGTGGRCRCRTSGARRCGHDDPAWGGGQEAWGAMRVGVWRSFRLSVASCFQAVFVFSRLRLGTTKLIEDVLR